MPQLARYSFERDGRFLHGWERSMALAELGLADQEVAITLQYWLDLGDQ